MKDNTFCTNQFFRKMNDEKFEGAIAFFKSMKEEVDKVMEENDKLKGRSNDDIFQEKNDEIEELKAQLRRKHYFDSFSFSPEKIKDFDNWWQDHISDPEIQKRMKILKNSGHHPTYEITPTEVGWWYGIRCSCGANYGDMD